MSQASRRRPRAEARDPYGIMSRAGLLAPALAVVGLVLVAFFSVQLWNNPAAFLPLPHRSNAPGQSAPPIDRTPLPSNQVQLNPKASVAGTLVYAKAGNLFIQHGTDVHQLTKSGSASNPVWSPDGKWVYYIQTRHDPNGYWPPQAPTQYDLYYPVLVRIHPDGTGQQDVLSSLITQGRYKYFYWIRQPSISPDGRTMAIISDGPQPDSQDTVLQFVDLNTGKLLPTPKLPENGPLGHTDPAYKPDGSAVAYVVEARDAAKGLPSIWLYNVAKRTAAQLSPDGYRNPSWSPDGRYLAAVKASNGKEDVVILDASNGRQVAQVTSDGASFYPVWSPGGDSIVYLHLTGIIVDLKMMHVSQDASGTFTFKTEEDLTEYSGLSETSPAAWYMAPDEMPTPTPEPSGPAASPSESASAS